MAEGAPAVTPSPALRERVLAGLQDDGRVSAADLSALAQQRTRPEAASPRFRRVLMGVAAASIVVAAGAALMLSRSNTARLDLERRYDETQAALATRDETIARQQALLDILLAPDLSTAALVSTAPTEPRLQLFWNRETDLLVIAAFNLQPAADGRIYQLWGIQGDNPPVSLGLFDAPSDDAPVTLTALASEPFDVAALTEEPAGGSPQPTSAPFLVGAWNHAN